MRCPVGIALPSRRCTWFLVTDVIVHFLLENNWIQAHKQCQRRQTLTTPCLKKNCAKLFLSELRQISTNFDNFWQKDGKVARIMRGALISTSRNSRHHTTQMFQIARPT